MAIPDKINSNHILTALSAMDQGEDLQGYVWPSTKYCLVYDNRHYPPKSVISVACKFATGEFLEKALFSGGEETNSFLRKRGFTVIEHDCGGKDAVQPN